MGPLAASGGTNRIYLGDNLSIMRQSIPDSSIDLIYVDPPFNTGKTQTKTTLRTTASREGDRLGFQGKRYLSTEVARGQFADAYPDYLAFIEPRLREAHRVLAPHGSIYLHLDYREVHYCKILMDALFGREAFLNEIIWAYDYGGRSKRRWPAKHDNILWYAKDPDNYIFNHEQIERVPYMAPGLVSAEKAARGKLPTDTWWHTIVGTNSREKTGYPTQKPVALARRIVSASSMPGDLVLDFFAGSGTVGEACIQLDRRFILIDESPAAMEVMAARFGADVQISWFGC